MSSTLDLKGASSIVECDRQTFSSFCVTPLLDKIESRDLTVAIIGLGYVGLPLLLGFSRAGYKVIGIDTDPEKIQNLAVRKSYIKHIPSEDIDRNLVRDRYIGRVEVITDDADVIIICLPTPLTKQRDPDLSYIKGAARTLKNSLRPGQVVILESTTWPGTTKEVLVPILEETGLKCGVDFFVAFSPEREDPGNKKFNLRTMPKVIGGEGKEATMLAKSLYEKIVDKVVVVFDSKTAESVKLTENIFRAVNIALVNELKIIYESMGVNVWEVIEAASTKPFGYMPFYPGPGLGGHCIPIDPFYLTWKAREFSLNTRFIELAGEINLSMPYYVISRLTTALNEQKKLALANSKILLLGMAYKKEIEDIRESPSIIIMSLLEKSLAQVDYHDPYVSEFPNTIEHGEYAGKKSVELTPEILKEYDAVIILTDHQVVNYQLVLANSELVVDTRNITAQFKNENGCCIIRA
jgi:UDP-N-acetyl-D-glucosamine dehydrogenase